MRVSRWQAPASVIPSRHLARPCSPGRSHPLLTAAPHSCSSSTPNACWLHVRLPGLCSLSTDHDVQWRGMYETNACKILYTTFYNPPPALQATFREQCCLSAGGSEIPRFPTTQEREVAIVGDPSQPEPHRGARQFTSDGFVFSCPSQFFRLESNEHETDQQEKVTTCLTHVCLGSHKDMRRKDRSSSGGSYAILS